MKAKPAKRKSVKAFKPKGAWAIKNLTTNRLDYVFQPKENRQYAKWQCEVYWRKKCWGEFFDKKNDFVVVRVLITEAPHAKRG